jgi:hypothetical protein
MIRKEARKQGIIGLAKPTRKLVHEHFILNHQLHDQA